ncbi:MAG: transcription termination factor Rho [Actinobacteria bacterium]|nr:transcription termination factor Rho [Actinomycetota bacterium]MCL5446062.1 transcription termination factor Rho [Actinomycetota bacterium]
MPDEQQLERTLLERKEREELRKIARALSIPVTTRLKKADIVDRILTKVGDGHGESSTSNLPVASASWEWGGNHGSTGGNGVAGVGEGATQREVRAQDSVEPNGNGLAAPSEASLQDDLQESGPVDGIQLWTAEKRAKGRNDEGVVHNNQQDIIVSGEAGDKITHDTQDGAVQDVVITVQDGAAHQHQDEVSQSTGIEEGERTEQFRESGDHVQAPVKARNQTQGQGQGQGQGQPASSGGRRNRRKRGKERSDRPDREMQSTPAESYDGELAVASGILDLREEGYGFLRSDGYLPSAKDVYVSISQVKKFALRKGDWIDGASRPAINNEKYPALIRIDTIGGMPAEEIKGRPRFEALTPLFPDQRLTMEIPGDTGTSAMTARIVDLLCPIGKGQRGLIVSPPKAGKTTVMKQIARSIEINNPEVHLMVLLVDERPEEVTDMRRSVKGEVVSSTFDRPSDEHTTVAELALERAKRLVELGKDVVIILDGITRLARAYNLAQPATGRIMSGGVDSGALYPPKKFFGAARNIEEGGSLTILATALVETGSKMDEVIFEEFKGTGNMELRLDRHLAERRVYPSIDVNASSTRHEELLFGQGQLQQVWKLRRVLNALAADGSAAAGLELLMDKIKTTKGNDDFLADIAKGPAPPM